MLIQKEIYKPALASDTALEIALLEIALFLFMISSNSASLNGVLAVSILLPGGPQSPLSYGGRWPHGSVGGGPQLCGVGMPLLVGGGKKAGFTCGAGGGAPGGGPGRYGGASIRGGPRGPGR